jgi:Zn-dependent protease
VFDTNHLVMNLLVRMPVILLALTVHEFAHAYSAWRLGDPTALRMGRCSLNPLAHLDLMGTICLMFGPIGWAKPVPVNALNFRHPSRDEMIVSVAGPLSNILQAVLWSLLMRLLNSGGMMGGMGRDGQAMLSILFTMCWLGIMVNCGLAVFNMLPVFPLDGFHVTRYFLSRDHQAVLDRTAQYGTYIVLGLVLMPYLFRGFSPLSTIISYPVGFMLTYVAGV